MYLLRSSLFYQLKLELVPFLVLLCHLDEQNFYVKLVTSAFLLTFISLVQIFVVLLLYFAHTFVGLCFSFSAMPQGF